jgi:xylose isomerase
MKKYGYKFSFGPWNIHEGADPFGPTVRKTVSFNKKLEALKEMGYDAMQFHDDDAVPDLDSLKPDEIAKKAKAMARKLKSAGLTAEFVAPRLWEHKKTIDGGYTSNKASERKYALDRSKKAADIAREMGTDLMVLWLAREGTYIREAKDAEKAVGLLVEAINTILEYDPDIRIAIEPKPNEPMDLAYLPTIGHALTVAANTVDPKRVGCLVESAHAILAGLDPSDEMAFALHFDKLYSVHLNDQNGLKFDQDKAFGSVDLRRAFNQVRVLDKAGYAKKGLIGMDVKAMRTQPQALATKHLRNSLQMFLRLVPIVRSLDDEKVDELIAARDYEELEWMILDKLLAS